MKSNYSLSSTGYSRAHDDGRGSLRDRSRFERTPSRGEAFSSNYNVSFDSSSMNGHLGLSERNVRNLRSYESSTSSASSVDFTVLSSRLRGRLKSSENSGDNRPLSMAATNGSKPFSNGDSGVGYGLKRENSDSTINSDADSIAPQSSVYSADLKGSEMTLNSGAFSLASSVASTPMHLNSHHSKYQSMEPVPGNEVGLRDLSNQIRRRYVRNGFRFNVMVVGETGLGKSTFVNTLFHSNICATSQPQSSGSGEKPESLLSSSNDRWHKTLKDSADKSQISASNSKSSYGSSSKNLKLTAGKPDEIVAPEGASEWTVDDFQCLVKEGDANMTLGLIDTPGFGQFLDNSKCVEPILEYITKQFDKYMTIESQIDRSNKENNKKGRSPGLSTKLQNDPRVHCCLYFLSPQNPHRLKAIDVETMKKLGDKVNLIPVIAKADTLTPEEVKDFKEMVLKEISTYDIRVFSIPELTTLQQQLDPDLGVENKKFKSLTPFAVCGSVQQRSDGLRIREYPFGTVEIENESHCDFMALRSILMQIHTWSLIDYTRESHYEKYRSNKLASSIGGSAGVSSSANSSAGKDGSKILTSSSSVNNKGPLAILSEEKKAHEERLSKMQDDMQRVFEQKVAEKERRLKAKEEEMMRKHEEMRRNLESQQVALMAAREQHERNLQAWTESTAAVANQNSATLGYPAEGDSNNYGTMFRKYHLKDKKKKLFGR